MKVIDSSENIGQAAFKVMNAAHPTVIDTAGHLFRPDRTAAHRGRGQEDDAHFDEEVDLFGASACACMYKREALDRVSVDGEIFDPDFGNYYEDVDLDWRLRLAGWKCRFAAGAVAYHHGHGSGMRGNVRVMIDAEKNRYLMMAKCDTRADRRGKRLEIALYEMYHALKYISRPYLLIGLARYFRFRARALKRRDFIQKSRDKSAKMILTPRFTIAGRELTKPAPTLADFELALSLPPIRTPEPGFINFQDADRRAKSRLRREPSDGGLPAVSVVVLNVNGAEMTRECLSGLDEQTYLDFEVILLDNGSLVDEAAVLKKDFPRVKVVRYPENTGFAGGVNRAVHYAEGELVALINNDCVPDPGWLDALVRRMEETGAAAVSGTMAEEKYFAPSPNHALNLLGRIIPGAFGDKPLSFFPSGGNCLFDLEDVISLNEKLPWRLGKEDGGVMSDFYLLYSEDVSLGWRLRLAGYSVEKAIDANASHRVSATAARFPSGLLRYFRYRNRMLNLLLFPETRTLLRILPLLIIEWLAMRFAGLFYWQLGEPLLSADKFFMTNMRAILNQRRIFQRGRSTPDSEILKFFTSAVSPHFPAVNRLVAAYLRIVGLNTLESRNQPRNPGI
ncbi:glycosyltransferase [bacterium]|nr:glycosyltransferase [bacterium]